MSESDFSLWLPEPETARPRRPLSISESTASCSIRFSLLTMISGAPSSSSRLSRLLRLMTRRYRSFRSEVAKRPPSSWTIGRRSGGMTGRTDKLLEVHPADDLADRIGTHARAEHAATLGAGAVQGIEAAELVLAERHHRLE